MKQFTSVKDVPDVDALAAEALAIKNDPFKYSDLGRNKTLGLIFLNPSLRTRLSTQKAAMNLGMQVMVMNMDKDGWALEFTDGSVMNGSTVEHIKDAAAIIGGYCDILGVRAFPGLKERGEDYGEVLLQKFIQYSGVPVISLESATLHPLQSLADAVTIKEQHKENRRPKVVLTWAPHIKPLPQAVANSFAEWMTATDVDLTIANPEGFDLFSDYTIGAEITHNQEEALQDADFVYVKNWSSYHDYGKVHQDAWDWQLTPEKMEITNHAKIMHCLPVRRNLELPDTLLDGPGSLVVQQAANRVFAAQAVLKNILQHKT